MTAYRQKLYAFEKTIQLIEESAMKRSFPVSDASFQALYNTYEEMKKLFPVSSDEVRTRTLAMQV
jgi:hypothetical protein